MNDLAARVQHGLMHGLRHRRVREYGVREVCVGGLKGLCDAESLNLLGHFGPDHMGTQ